ncbi:anti-CBASS protein Acb1 family protein, partial [Pseudomonas aeruginosa]|uniref:anti-CBASS protein Acb1 family protein n=1 Tax=Pseudomonas aeruginosa TaxID=287 RepID=UPI001EDE3412
MGVRRFLTDKLVNFVANLGTERDKAAGSFYAPVVLTDEQLHNAYRGAWFPRKVVDIPAKDATRRWRAWQASKAQIEKIEAEEKRLHATRRWRAWQASKAQIEKIEAEEKRLQVQART